MIYSYAVLSMGLCIKHIRRIVTINDTTWKATSRHALILSTSCSLRFFPSWLSKWAPYMDSLAETSCKCHVGLRREKTHETHTNTQRVELHVDMLIFSQENCSQIWNLEFFFAHPLTKNANPTLIDRDGPHRHGAWCSSVSSGVSS